MSNPDGREYWMTPDGTESAPGDPAERREDERGWSRRSFLRAAGFAGAGAVLASCSPAPVKKAIPFLVPAEEVVPGRATWYASTCAGCAAGCGVMVKNRDGRPIKLEGFRGGGGALDRSHPISGGGLCAAGQAGLLGLYDSMRHQGPRAHGKPATWDAVDAELAERFAAGGIAVLTTTITSPTTRARLAEFLAKHGGSEHVVYDEQSLSALADAHERAFGRRVVPRYRFERADVVVGVGCDFLGTWLSPVEFTAGWASRREPASGDMSWHMQVEPTMSVTGSKADERIVATPRQQARLLADLARRIAERAGVTPPPGLPVVDEPLPGIDELESRLWRARGRSIVVSAMNHHGAQVAACFINDLLGNYGRTLDMAKPSRQRAGRDSDLAALIEKMEAGAVKTLIVHGLNPVHDLPERERIASALAKVEMVVSTAGAPDETSDLAQLVCPEPHFLERWDDAVAVEGVLSMTQPAIAPLFDTRHFRESLAAWSGAGGDDLAYRKDVLKELVGLGAAGSEELTAFFDRALHDGVVGIPATELTAKPFDVAAFDGLPWPAPAGGPGLELLLIEQTGMPSGRFAHNAWLQELPDPITKMSWGNAALLGVEAANELGVEDGDVVQVRRGEVRVELPARIQPGQHDGVVAIPLGYGRSGTGRFSKVGPDWIEARPSVGADGLVGVSAAPLSAWQDGLCVRDGTVTVAPTGRHVELALAQTWGSIDVPAETAPDGERRRDVVRETTTAALAGAAGESGHASHAADADLWSDDHPNGSPQWGMSIDLNRCTGCSACVVACQVENNIPVVGRDEVRRRRDMYWLRIDRYYSGDPESPNDVDVVHQPMLCHHCDNAPCETVCPVLATVHSEEGLNQQVYNRCVGTRYCANNCPYKVRRFNWFDYAHEDRLQNMVLNPDIAVRSRGVMEKCSFCVQRIQEAKTEAKRNGVELDASAVQPACVQTCPSEAIVFGDVSKAEAPVAKAMRDPLGFKVLDELNVKPSVSYRTLVRNRDERGG